MVVFKLKDNSRIVGQILSYKDGVYTVETKSVGKVQVRTDKIAEILFDAVAESTSSSSTASSPKTQANPDPSEAAGAVFAFDSVLRAVLGNPALMKDVQSLQDSEQMKAVLADETIRKAITRGDFAALMSNEKIIALLNDPKIKGITSQVQEKAPDED